MSAHSMNTCFKYAVEGGVNSELTKLKKNLCYKLHKAYKNISLNA